jgi:hypothetical protein
MAMEEGGHVRQLALPADQRRGLHGQIRVAERLQRREAAVAKLEEALRRAQVFQPVFTEVAHAGVCREQGTRAM